MAEIVLDVHDSVFEYDLRCEFEVKKPTLEELLKEITEPEFIEKFKKQIGEKYVQEIEKIGVNLHLIGLRFI